MERSREDLTYDLFCHIAGKLKDPKKEWVLIEPERYLAKIIFLTQISILAAILVIAL